MPYGGEGGLADNGRCKGSRQQIKNIESWNAVKPFVWLKGATKHIYVHS